MLACLYLTLSSYQGKGIAMSVQMNASAIAKQHAVAPSATAIAPQNNNHFVSLLQTVLHLILQRIQQSNRLANGQNATSQPPSAGAGLVSPQGHTLAASSPKDLKPSVVQSQLLFNAQKSGSSTALTDARSFGQSAQSHPSHLGHAATTQTHSSLSQPKSIINTDQNSGRTIQVDKPIIVHAGEVFDGHGATYAPTKNIGDWSQNEHQKPLFIVENGGTLANLKMSGGDGVHFLGDGKMINVTNTRVGEDAVTIDGQKNRQHDGRIAGTSADELPHRAHVEISHCTFNQANDKVVQDNGLADISLNDVHVNGAGKVVRTNGGDRSLNSSVTLSNSSFRGVKEAVFRTDAPHSHASFHNVQDDAPHEILAINPAEQSSGAQRLGTKAYTG